MAKLNTLEQYDVTTTWYTICSIGAVFSIVFSIMGIKWWFRKRVTFEQDANLTASGNRRPQQEISVVTTGIYRSTLDEDGLLDLSERTKTLPPIKIKHNQGPPIVFPRRQKSMPESSLYSKYPEPEEVISVENAEARLPLSPPPTPINSNKEDLSKPVVIDVYIPDEQIGEIRTENELKIPEIHQRLSVENLSEPPDYAQVVKVPKPRARISIQVQASEHEPLLKSKKTLQPEPEYETLQFEKIGNNNVIVKDDESIYESDNSNIIKEHDRVISENIPIKPKLTMDSREDPIASSLELNEFEKFIEEERKVMESHNEQTINVSDTEQIEEPLKKSNLKTHLSYVDTTPIDATKIESPKPLKKSRKGILKNKKAPPAPVPVEPIISVKEDEVKQMLEEEQIKENSIQIKDDTEDVELRQMKEVSFRDRESFIPSKSFSIDDSHHEEIIQEESIQEDDKLDEKKENIDNSTPSRVDIVTADDGVTVVVIGVDPVTEASISENSFDQTDETVSKFEPKEPQIELPNTLTISINNNEAAVFYEDGLEKLEDNKHQIIDDNLDEHDINVDNEEENINTKINEKVLGKIETSERELIKRDSISDTESENILFDKNHADESAIGIVKVEDENVEIKSKDPIPKPKPRQLKFVNQDDTLEIILNESNSMVKDNWEPQTIVHNNQVLVITPPPKYAPPTLPNSFLSDEEEDETDEESNETNPPKPPPRVRIYVINSDDDQKNIKSILKTKIPCKKVSFDHGVPDLIPRTPDTPTSIDAIDAEITVNKNEDPSIVLVPNLSELELEVGDVPNEIVKPKDLLDDGESVPMSEILQPQVVTKPRMDSRSDSIDEEDLIESKIKEIQQLLHDATDEDVQNSISQPFLLFDTEENEEYQFHEDPIKSPLDEKIEIFKNLTEQMNLSSSLLFNHSLDDQPSDLDEKLLNDTFDRSAKQNKRLYRNFEISRAMSEDPEPKTKTKHTRRQMSAPVMSQKDALMAEIRAFGEKRKLTKKAESTGYEHQIKKVVPVLQLEEDIEAQI